MLIQRKTSAGKVVHFRVVGNINQDVEIPRQHKDIALRSMSAIFKEEVLPFLGLDLPKVKEVIQTNVPVIHVKDRATDINFVLADNTILHIEFESGESTTSNLIRYAHYDLELYHQRKQKIRRLVVYASNVKKTSAGLDTGSVNQVQTPIHPHPNELGK